VTIPRVTEICSLFYPCDFYDDLATEAGTFFHEYIAAALSDNNIIAHEFDALGAEPFLAPLGQWLRSEVTMILEVENQEFGVDKSFSGRPDAILETRSYGRIFVDWKTGKSETEAHKMQSSCYELLISLKWGTMKCRRLYLGNGRVDIKRTTNPAGYQAAFLAGVRFWEAKHMLKGL